MNVLLTPTQIEEYLYDRLDMTNSLWEKRDTTDLEQEKRIIFLYFFDLSSAVESFYRNITLKISDGSDYLDCFNYLTKAKDQKHPYFLEWEFLQNLFKDIEISDLIQFEDFKKFSCSHIKALDKYTPNYNFNSIGDFKDIYNSIKTQRNKFAHGLLSYVNGDFTYEKLSHVSCLVYLLLRFYESIY